MRVAHFSYRHAAAAGIKLHRRHLHHQKRSVQREDPDFLTCRKSLPSTSLIDECRR
jgi:hypothetical protein